MGPFYIHHKGKCRFQLEMKLAYKEPEEVPYIVFLSPSSEHVPAPYVGKGTAVLNKVFMSL